MTVDPYRTVADRARIDFTIRGSEFVGHVAPVEDVPAAEAFVEAIETEYADATHNVPAYRVRVDPQGELLREYERDADEPAGSAGKPALNVLQRRNLENVVAVVTRYYGGTNLGVGGLVRAYSRAVNEAVEAAGVLERRPRARLALTVAYDDSGTVRAILESEAVAFEAAYDEEVRFHARVPLAEADALCDRLRSATSDRVEIEEAHPVDGDG